MKLRLKIALCVLLVIFAAMSVVTVMTRLGLLPSLAAAASSDAAYMIREQNGTICVFCPPAAQTPAITTEIPVRGLPLADRLALMAGIEADDYSQVVRLLEDYGS